MSKGHKICNVLPGSIGEEAGLKPGDFVVSINGKEIIDIFDYQYLSDEEYLEVLIRQEDGEEWILEVEKDEDEDLGLEFENGLMDEYRSCRNKSGCCRPETRNPEKRRKKNQCPESSQNHGNTDKDPEGAERNTAFYHCRHGNQNQK